MRGDDDDISHRGRVGTVGSKPRPKNDNVQVKCTKVGKSEYLFTACSYAFFALCQPTTSMSHNVIMSLVLPAVWHDDRIQRCSVQTTSGT